MRAALIMRKWGQAEYSNEYEFIDRDTKYFLEYEGGPSYSFCCRGYTHNLFSSASIIKIHDWKGWSKCLSLYFSGKMGFVDKMHGNLGTQNVEIFWKKFFGMKWS